jgi:starvation-inducible DNA-binding protein
MENYDNPTPKEATVAELGMKLAHTLSDVVTAKFLAHGYHWNVMGPNFSQLHEFYSEIYEDIDGSIDPIAENILKLGFDAPYLLQDFQEMTCIREDRIDGGNAQAMSASLLKINEMLVKCFTELFDLANALNIQNVANFAAERIDAHAKWVWQLKATLGAR